MESEEKCVGCTPIFDEELCMLAIFNDHTAVRKKWPRFSGTCKICGYTGIKYASFKHYLYGDW